MRRLGGSVVPGDRMRISVQLIAAIAEQGGVSEMWVVREIRIEDDGSKTLLVERTASEERQP